MNKTFLTTIVYMLAVLVFSSGICFAAGDNPQVGVVATVKGSATVSRAGSDNAVKEGIPVFVGDRITTGSRSRVKLLMNDDSILTIGQKSDMTIQEYDYRPKEDVRSSVLSLLAGNLRSIITKFTSGAGSKYEVHTPTAVSGARGTINIASVVNEDRTLVVGESNMTDVSNIDPSVQGTQTLHDNLGCYVDRGMPPSDPFEMTDDVLGPLVGDTTLSLEVPPVVMPEAMDMEPEFPEFTPDETTVIEVPTVPPVEQEPPSINIENPTEPGHQMIP